MTGAFLGLSVRLVVKDVAGLGLGVAARSCSRVVAVGWLTLIFVVCFVLSFFLSGDFGPDCHRCGFSGWA